MILIFSLPPTVGFPCQVFSKISPLPFSILWTLDKGEGENSPRHWNTGLVSSGTSLTSWGKDASLALVGNTSSDGVTKKMPYGVDVLH